MLQYSKKDKKYNNYTEFHNSNRNNLREFLQEFFEIFFHCYDICGIYIGKGMLGTWLIGQGLYFQFQKPSAMFFLILNKLPHFFK